MRLESLTPGATSKCHCDVAQAVAGGPHQSFYSGNQYLTPMWRTLHSWPICVLKVWRPTRYVLLVLRADAMPCASVYEK